MQKEGDGEREGEGEGERGRKREGSERFLFLHLKHLPFVALGNLVPLFFFSARAFLAFCTNSVGREEKHPYNQCNLRC